MFSIWLYAAVTDCRCIIKHLAPLSVYVENLNKAEFKDAKNLIATLMQMFCLTWVHCEPVRQASRIINIIKEILNSVIAVVSMNFILCKMSVFISFSSCCCKIFHF